MSAKGRRAPAIEAARIRWRFADGRDMDVPLVDVEAQLQAQYHAMATCDDPVLRMQGRARLKEAAEQAAAKQLADQQAAGAAHRPRPGARSPLKERVQAMMRHYRRGGTEFKVFLQAWERDAIDGLRLTPAGNKYLVDDEEGDAGMATYTLATLTKHYSTCMP